MSSLFSQFQATSRFPYDMAMRLYILFAGTLMCNSEFNPRCFCGERNYIGAPFDVEWLHRMIDDKRLDSGRLLNAQAGYGRGLGCCGEADVQGAGGGIKLHAFKLAGVEREPCPQRSHVDAHAKGIERRDFHGAAFNLEVASESQPAELRMVDNVSGRVQSMAEKVRAVIPGERIKLEHVRKCVG